MSVAPKANDHSPISGSAHNGAAFHGAKVALLVDEDVVSLLRDDKAGIPWPNCWDMIGGGREGDESAIACALRETLEETGLVLQEADIIWGRKYTRGTNDFWFFVARLGRGRIEMMQKGVEGQRLELMTVVQYLSNPRAVGHFQQRLADYVAGVETHLECGALK